MMKRLLDVMRYDCPNWLNCHRCCFPLLLKKYKLQHQC